VYTLTASADKLAALLTYIGRLPRPDPKAKTLPTAPAIAAAGALGRNRDAVDLLLANTCFVMDLAASAVAAPGAAGMPHVPNSLLVDTATGLALYGFYRDGAGKVQRGLFPPAPAPVSAPVSVDVVATAPVTSTAVVAGVDDSDSDNDEEEGAWGAPTQHKRHKAGAGAGTGVGEGEGLEGKTMQ
jgi:hypothetical protein